MNTNFVDVFGKNPSNKGTMQVIVFDKFYKCIYRLKNIPKDWNFLKVAEALKLQHDPRQYQAIRLANFDELCIDDYMFENGELKLTSTKCHE